MIGKRNDSGFRDYDLLEKQYMLEAQYRIREYILELKDNDQHMIDRHNHMMNIDQQDSNRRYLNTFDFDEVLGSDFFDCLVQEQGINDFEPYALVEYKSISNTYIGVLKQTQRKALVKFAKRANLPAYVVWSLALADGSYNWFTMCVYHPNENVKLDILECLSDKQYYRWKMKMRNLGHLIDHNYTSSLSDSYARTYEKTMDRILEEAIK